MEGEIGTGARIAVALIILGVIISVVFVILGFVRGTTNQGLASVQNAMDSMVLSQYDDYDQQILSGAQVKSAIKLFEGRPVATCVATSALNGVPASPMPTTPKTFNYGAQLVGAASVGAGKTPQVTMVLTNPTDSFFTVNQDTATGIRYYMNVFNVSKSGDVEFVRPTAKFMSRLVKDTTGTIVGICFIQQ